MLKKYCRDGQATADNTAHAQLRAGYVSEYVILFALPLLQWSPERASMLAIVIHPLPVLFKLIKMIQNHGEHRSFTPFHEHSTEPVLFGATVNF